MECTIQSMAEACGGQDDNNPPAIPSGKVGQVCREWLVREDGVLAYQLQNEEINKHYDNNRSKNQVVRSDLHQAKSLQEYEYQEMMRRYQEELQKQLDNDARIAEQIQEQELRAKDASKSGLQRQESIVERDRLIAERLQAKEKMKVLKYKLLKEKRQVERVASGGMATNGHSPTNDTHSNHSNDSGNGGHRGRHRHNHDIVDVTDLTEFCIKPPEDLTEEEKRIFLEEQDAELARFLQKQEAARNVAKDTTKQTIETHDAEIARILQEQEKAKARKLREKARQRALQRQQLMDQQQSMSTSGNHHRNGNTGTNKVNSQSISHVHPSTSSHSPASSHSPTTSASHFTGSTAHSPSMSSNANYQELSFAVSGYPHSTSSQQQQHHQVSSVPSHCQSSNPNGNGGNSDNNSSPQQLSNNNHSYTSNCCPVTTPTHYQYQPHGTFDTLIQQPDDDEECYDDDNPIVDNYYPVGDDLKRMSSNQGHHNHRSDGYKVSTDVSSTSNGNNFHNIAMDLDPTYNRSVASNSPSNGHHGHHSSDTDINGLHFAQFCRVSPSIVTENGGNKNGSKATGNKSPEINQAILPVPGHRRQERSKNKNKKMAEGCKQQ